MKTKEHEYLFTVVVRRKDGTWERREVEARTIGGVAALLKVKLDDLMYVSKEIL